MSRRLLVSTLALGALGFSFISDGSSAAPLRNTVKIVCDRTTDSATATVQFVVPSPGVTVSCSSADRSDTVNVFGFDVAQVEIPTFSVQAGGSQDCAQTGASIPLKIECNAPNGGATLIVR